MNRYLPRALALLLLGALAHPRVAGAQSLRGSPTSVNRMYYHAVDHGMYFYKSASGLRKAVAEGRFERLRGNADYRVSGASYPYAQEAAILFVERLAADYRQACGEPLVVTSAVRPQEMRLANSVDRSVHPTGMAVDLRRPTRRRCLTWLRSALTGLEGAGLIEATEELSPAHFHVAVFPTPFTRYVARMEESPTKLATVVSSRPRLHVGQILLTR